ncbi:hypothetical protein AQUCO_01700400v1 [Aquilegia coerulea]|uniref:Response regulatory domain-containing protein n=1 Tax=Aquilegia coerulea TaxID=218851 RepID=A0A2G5DMN8_AQUCA|nr:hypothetical protein AQUCO_01700400v1 [Aquilegia coerulea]
MASTSASIQALVVDDDTMIRKIHCKVLKKAGINTQEAVNGKEAVDLCSSGAVFDVILMDFAMPIMNGPEATRILREMKVASKIIGATGQSRAEEIQEFKDAGLDECLEKPLTLEKISSIIGLRSRTQVL